MYNIINILGLSLGLASTFILFKIVLNEINTDKFHKNYNQICYSTIRVTPLSVPRHSWINFGTTDVSDYPEIKFETSLEQVPVGEITVGDNYYKLPITVVDSAFNKVFSFPLLYGNYDNLFENLNSIILSKTVSEKLFGTLMSVGETLELEDKKLKVVGVLDDPPGNSSIHLKVIVPDGFHNWSYMGVEFILLNDNVNLVELNDKIKFLARDHSQSPEGIQECMPLNQLYFDTNVKDYHGDLIIHGSEKLVKILLLITCIIFVVSIFNFLNIYLVTLQKRAKEIGILCIHGAGKRYLAKYFLKENVLSVGISALLVILIYSILSPYIPLFLGKSLPVNPVEDLILLLGISIILIVITSIITTLRFNKINPLSYIKEVSTGIRALILRRTSMAIQYVMTICLIIVSIFFIKQLNFMLNSDMGFKSKNIICTPFFSRVEMLWGLDGEAEKEAIKEWQEKRTVMKSNQQYVIDEINKNPYIEHLCFGASPFDFNVSPWKNMNSSQDFMDAADWNIPPSGVDLFDLKVLEGRFFDKEKDRGHQRKVVINESAIRYYGIEDASKGMLANRYWGGEKDPWKVIGVVEDFSFDHLSKEILPLVIYFFGDKVDNDLMVEIAEGKEAESIEFLRQLFEKVNPGKTFTYHFVEDEITQLYEDDEKLVKVYSLFTIIALIISSLGLFSFSIYDVQQRFKEIGIRKVNGSGIWETVLFLTKPVFVLLGIAFVIAVPVAWIGILKYLEEFANKAPLSWWIFALAGFFTLIISILTVITQSYKAATRNPVEILRYE